jgi:MYXO-CTERM domain-containing protein
VERRKQEEHVRTTSTAKILATAAFIALTPVAAAAQNAADNTTTGDTTIADDTTNTQYRTVEREDNDFPWGLLGLLGLAGLLGRKRKDADIHVDARHNTRP